MSYGLSCVFFVETCVFLVFLWCVSVACSCVFIVFVRFRCDLVCDAARFEFGCVCCVCVCVPLALVCLYVWWL